MKDIGTQPQTDDPVRDVVERLARRRQNDAEIAYLISPGTETYELLVRALMSMHGADQPKVESALRCSDPRPTRWAELQARVDRLEALLDEHHPDWRDEEDGR